jgi:hypothetical protein
MKTYWVSGCIDPHFLDLGPGRFTPRERAPGTHWIGGWVDPRASLDDVENRDFLTLPGFELGRPACSRSLYRLRYSGFRYRLYTFTKIHKTSVIINSDKVSHWMEFSGCYTGTQTTCSCPTALTNTVNSKGRQIYLHVTEKIAFLSGLVYVYLSFPLSNIGTGVARLV